jgi:short-subunit dehydrogenase
LNCNAVIIGASSGIGLALAHELTRRGYTIGLAARRVALLDEIAGTLKSRTVTQYLDVTEPDAAIDQLRSLILELGSVDLFVISSGTGHENPRLEWELERDTIETNVLGFAAIANVAAEHLASRGSGTLVGISSIAAIRGNGGAPAYGASKAFVSHYLAALRHKFAKLGSRVVVLDVKPGFVDTAMAKGDGLFCVASPKKASTQILKAIDRQRTHVYITRRWRLVAWVLRLLPNALYNRM